MEPTGGSHRAARERETGLGWLGWVGLLAGIWAPGMAQVGLATSSLFFVLVFYSFLFHSFLLYLLHTISKPGQTKF
jgi:hypothetical protein